MINLVQWFSSFGAHRTLSSALSNHWEGTSQINSNGMVFLAPVPNSSLKNSDLVLFVEGQSEVQI